MEDQLMIVGVVVIGLTVAFVFALTQTTPGLRSFNKQNGGIYRAARAKRIVDGDTVIVAVGWQQITLCLYGISCPKRDQPWSDSAECGLVKLIGRKKICYQHHGPDRSGRTLATVFVLHPDGRTWINVNARMVMLGHAWAAPVTGHHPSDDRQTELARLQRWAESKQVGLWQNPDAIPPWKWRRDDDSAA